MKKIFAVIMAIMLLFSFSACKSESSSASSTPVISDVADDNEVNYAVALIVSINPKIKLFLDENGIVVAIEAMNSDATQIVGQINFENTSYQSVIKEFVNAANQKGFIKADAEIEFEVAELKTSTLTKKDILTNASASAAAKADELKISLKVKGDETASQDTSSLTETSSSTHQHSFSKATCTQAAKCSCGATDGKALGHKWSPATCKSPKTCTVCKATEGAIGEHTYSNGKCSVCGFVSTLNPKTNIKKAVEYIGNLQVSGSMLNGAALQFEEDVCVVTTRFFNSVKSDPEQKPIVFKGKNYYSEGGGQEPHNFELTDTEIIIKGSLWEGDANDATIKLVLQGDGMLRVTYSKNSLFPVGAILSTNINDVLK